MKRDGNGAGGRVRRIARVGLLGLVLFSGFSYRFYLARFHTEVGIPGMAAWHDYILENVARLEEGRGLNSTLYAPGQSISAYLLYRVFPGSPAMLRVAFGLIDGIAVFFLFLLGRELYGWWAGLCAAFLYAMWPEGASASVNILHDHSPQPLFFFAGLWLVLRWLRQPHWATLVGGGILLGLLPLFRTDGILVTGAVPLAVAAALWRSGLPWKRAAGCVLVLGASTLLLSLPYDLYINGKTGQRVHIAAGDVGSAVFLRYGRTTGQAGTRFNDTEIASLSGVHEPFGYAWKDSRRTRVLSRFGKDLFWADPLRYLRVIAKDSWPHLVESAGFQYWLAPGLTSFRDAVLSPILGGPEWSAAAWVSFSRLQAGLSRRRLLLLGGLMGTVVGLCTVRRRILVVITPLVLWVGALLCLVPDSRYMLMPFCLLFVLLGVAMSWAGQVVQSGLVRLMALRARTAGVGK